jgi:hypothetical protein
MAYIARHPKHGQTLTTLPKTVAGYLRRYQAETKELGRLQHTKPRVVLKVIRSWTLIQAEALGAARFRQLCRELGLSMRSPTLSWHRLLARNAGKLLSYADWLPDDDAALAQLAKLDADRLLHLCQLRRHDQRVTASRLKQLAKLENRNG